MASQGFQAAFEPPLGKGRGLSFCAAISFVYALGSFSSSNATPKAPDDWQRREDAICRALGRTCWIARTRHMGKEIAGLDLQKRSGNEIFLPSDRFSTAGKNHGWPACSIQTTDFGVEEIVFEHQRRRRSQRQSIYVRAILLNHNFNRLEISSALYV